MFEKVNPGHPDKVADRIAGALVDIAYEKQPNPKIAVEVLLGHGVCHIIAETSVDLDITDVGRAVHRIAGSVMLDYREVPQDVHLAKNQEGQLRCGDNGIFKGAPVTEEQGVLSDIAHCIYDAIRYDGKYILNKDRLIVCQSNAESDEIKAAIGEWNGHLEINPLGSWTGGSDVDCGATNRKLGSDMGDAVTGGGLHGKDFSKADVSVNVVCHILAQECGKSISAACAIGDEEITFIVDGGTNIIMPYSKVVEKAHRFISDKGGFEKFAEWGLI